MVYALLSSRAVLAISGPEAVSFLQGLITNDMRRLEAGKPLYAALLSPQGKFLHDFFLYSAPGRILLDTEASRLAELKQRLALYKLRAQLVVEDAPEGIIAIWDEGKAPDHEGLFADPRLPYLGWRLMGDAKAMAAWCEAAGYLQADEAAYDAMRIQHGVPDGSRDMIPDKSFLLEYGIDELNGIDFNKGCYVGQEVTTRTKFRGQVRKFLYRVETQDAFPPPGTAVFAGDAEAGQLRSHAGRKGLALLRSELVEKAAAEGLPMVAGEAKLTAEVPAWFSGPTAQKQEK